MFEVDRGGFPVACSPPSSSCNPLEAFVDDDMHCEGGVPNVRPSSSSLDKLLTSSSSLQIGSSSIPAVQIQGNSPKFPKFSVLAG